MEKLFDPEIGLQIWEILAFMGLLLLLWYFGRKPLAEALKKREGKIRSDIDRAAQAVNEAAGLRLKYEQQVSSLGAWIRQQMKQTEKEMEKIKEDLRVTTERETARIFENANRQLFSEQEELIRRLRSSTALLSLDVAEKILVRAVNSDLQSLLFQDAVKEMGEVTLVP